MNKYISQRYSNESILYFHFDLVQANMSVSMTLSLSLSLSHVLKGKKMRFLSLLFI